MISKIEKSKSLNRFRYIEIIREGVAKGIGNHCCWGRRDKKWRVGGLGTADVGSDFTEPFYSNSVYI